MRIVYDNLYVSMTRISWKWRVGNDKKDKENEIKKNDFKFCFLIVRNHSFQKKMWIFQIQGKVFENFIFGYFNSEKILSRTSDFKKVVGRGGAY